MSEEMSTRRLGEIGPVPAPALGCMGMSGVYGPSDRQESIATVHAALDAGITLIDTGDFYDNGHNELLVAEALGHRRDDVLLSVKFGAMRDPAGGWVGYDARPAAVKNFLTYSLRRLGTDHIDIYRPARLDPEVPIEDTVGAIVEMIEAGYVRHIGLSEVGAGTIRRAQAVHPITDVQIEYSLVSRSIETSGVLDTCRDHGIGITAYGVLSRGLLSGNWHPDRGGGPGDFRAHSPRFQGENLTRNLALVEALGELAREKGVTTAQLAVAWVLHRGADIVPVIGARRREQLADALAASSIRLTDDELAAIEKAVPAEAVAGDRYAPAQMASLDSERS